MIVKHGNIFESRANVLVNPVNCVGAMGKGLAKQFWDNCACVRKPYSLACEQQTLRPGVPLLVPGGGLRPFMKRYVCLFPTKDHYRDPSRYEWIRDGLEHLLQNYESQSWVWAFPLLGAGLGGLDAEAVKELMIDVLGEKISWELWLR